MEFIQNLGMPQRLLAAALVIGVLALLLLRQRSAQTASSAGREKAAKKERTRRSLGRGGTSSSGPASKGTRMKGKKESGKATSGGRGRRRKRDEAMDTDDAPMPAAVGRMVPRLPAPGEASAEDPFAGAIGASEVHHDETGTVRSADGLVAEPGWPSNDGWSNGELAPSDQSTQAIQPVGAESSGDGGAGQAPQTDWSDDADDFDPATGWGAEEDTETPPVVDDTTTESEWTEETADWTVEAGWETVEPAADTPGEVTDHTADWEATDTAPDALDEPAWTEDAPTTATAEDWHSEDEADLASAWQPVDEESGAEPEQSFSDWGSAEEAETIPQDAEWVQTGDDVEQIQDFSWEPNEHEEDVHAVVAPLPIEASGIDSDGLTLPTGGLDEVDALADSTDRWGASVGDVAHDALDAEPAFVSSMDGFDMTPEAYVDVDTSDDLGVDPSPPHDMLTAGSSIPEVALDLVQPPVHPAPGTEPFAVTAVDESAPTSELIETAPQHAEVDDVAPASTREPMVVIEPAVIAAPAPISLIDDEPAPTHQTTSQDPTTVDRTADTPVATDDASAQPPVYNPVAALVGDQNTPTPISRTDEGSNDPSLVKSAPVPNPLHRWAQLAPSSETPAQDRPMLRSWERMQPSVTSQTPSSAASPAAPVATSAPATTAGSQGAWWDQPLHTPAPVQAQHRGRFALGGFALAPGHHVVSGITFRESVVPPPTSWRLGPVDGPVAPGTLVLNVDGCLNCQAEDLQVLVEPGFLPTQDGFSLRLSALQNGPFAASGTFVIH